MALTFNSTIALPSGLEVANAYGRVAAIDVASGTQVDAIVDIYASEAAFTSGLSPVEVGFNRVASIAYNRATDGTDILNIGHDALVAMLTAQGISVTKNL